MHKSVKQTNTRGAVELISNLTFTGEAALGVGTACSYCFVTTEAQWVLTRTLVNVCEHNNTYTALRYIIARLGSWISNTPVGVLCDAAAGVVVVVVVVVVEMK